MQEVFSNFYDLIMNFIAYLGVYGPILGCFLIICESILPVLPLFVFITMNTIAFGKIIGFIISWICTIIGCTIAYFLVKKLGYNFIEKHISEKNILKKALNYVKKLNLSQLTVIMAIPFTPAFMVNIAAALSGIPYKKYFVCLLISKIFLVYFWGTVGTGLIESLKHPENLIIILVMVILAYIFSKIVSRVLKLNW